MKNGCSIGLSSFGSKIPEQLMKGSVLGRASHGEVGDREYMQSCLWQAISGMQCNASCIAIDVERRAVRSFSFPRRTWFKSNRIVLPFCSLHFITIHAFVRSIIHSSIHLSIHSRCIHVLPGGGPPGGGCCCHDDEGGGFCCCC